MSTVLSVWSTVDENVPWRQRHLSNPERATCFRFDEDNHAYLYCNPLIRPTSGCDTQRVWLGDVSFGFAYFLPVLHSECE